MDHYFQNVKGWFDFEKLYQEMVETFPSGSHFVEVGACRGKSTTFMAVEIINSQKKIQFDVIDIWDRRNVYKGFLHNIQPVKHIAKHHKMPSVEASKLFPDNSLDFVFIDADHSYEPVKSDIIAWLPKVKNTGVIAGHDYNSEHGYGVIQAVNELLKGFEVRPSNSPIPNNVWGNCWLYRKKSLSSTIKNSKLRLSYR